MPSPSIDPSIKVLKTFTYRGSPRVWSNRYYFDNLAPTDSTHWTTLADAITTAEKAVYPTTAGFSITGVLGYDAGSDVPIFSKTYSLAGTGSFGSTVNAPGDCAALVRYTTAARSSKNHPIYLFNYYHCVQGPTSGGGDILNANQKSALQTYAALWVAGFSDGTVTHHRCGPHGHPATGYLVDGNIRHRDFPAG